jgi:hypothetical protein
MKDLPILPGQKTQCVQPAPGAPPRVQSSTEPSLAFQALIERLREQARTLEQSTAEPLSARDLPGAVQAAQHSLQDALSIADGLVEAYRSSLVQGQAAPRTEPAPPGRGPALMDP